jgi:hypothetical protein
VEDKKVKPSNSDLTSKEQSKEDEEMQEGQLESETTAPASAPSLAPASAPASAEETGAETEQRLNTPEVGQLSRHSVAKIFYFLDFFYILCMRSFILPAPINQSIVVTGVQDL